MGVKDLAKHAKASSTTRDFNKAVGVGTVAVDASVWMYKKFKANKSWVEKKDSWSKEETAKVVKALAERLQSAALDLTRDGAKAKGAVKFVFDGAKLPLKERVRAERQTEKVRLPEGVAEGVRLWLKSKGWRCEQAPVEADHQLAHLVKTEQVDAVATVDSDVLLFGLPCVLLEDHGIFKECDPAAFLEELFGAESNERNVEMMHAAAVLNNCDYVRGLEKVGFKRSTDAVRDHGTLERSLDHLLSKGYVIPDDPSPPPPSTREEARDRFLDRARDALYVFQYAWVYGKDGKPRHLTEPHPSEPVRTDLIGVRPPTRPSSPAAAESRTEATHVGDSEHGEHGGPEVVGEGSSGGATETAMPVGVVEGRSRGGGGEGPSAATGTTTPVAAKPKASPSRQPAVAVARAESVTSNNATAPTTTRQAETSTAQPRRDSRAARAGEATTSASTDDDSSAGSASPRSPERPPRMPGLVRQISSARTPIATPAAASAPSPGAAARARRELTTPVTPVTPAPRAAATEREAPASAPASAPAAVGARESVASPALRGSASRSQPRRKSRSAVGPPQQLQAEGPMLRLDERPRVPDLSNTD